jgi:hypothetical protein
VTQLVVDGRAGPRLHAFVVGVGHYPHCDDPPDRGPGARLLGDLSSVTSPPPSATAVAEWLLSAPRGGDDPPVGTVEVLVSAKAPAAVRRADGAEVPVANADFAEFKAAFQRWRAACDADDGNIALFYFCGHGWHVDGQLLLLEDVGRDPEAVLENCVELSDIRAVMQQSKARTQLYFVDACRQLPPDFYNLEVRTKPLANVHRRVTLPLPPLDAPVYFSTAQRLASRVDRAAVTPFTAAVLRTLDGLGAHRVSAERWTVETDRFGLHLREVIAWDNPGTDRSQCLTTEGAQSGSSVLRTLDGPPSVPVEVACVPEHALPLAELSIHDLDGGACPPLHLNQDRRGELVAGSYQLDLTYPRGAGFRTASVFAEVMPPNKTWRATVERA